MRRKKPDKEQTSINKRALGDNSKGAAHVALAETLERLVAQLIDALPVLDMKILEAALAEVKARPRASLRYLFEQFTSTEPAARAVARRILATCDSAGVTDELKAIIFDADQDPWAKVLANDLLDELGSPVDADVFAMSVVDPEALATKLPSRVLRFLAEGDVKSAVGHACTLHPADRTMIIYEVAARQKQGAVEFLKAIAEGDEANAAAVVGAIGAEKLDGGVPLLLELQRAAGRDLQKLIKKTLFELRKAGVEIPEEMPRSPLRPGSAADGDSLSPYRMMIGEQAPDGTVLVMMTWKRPNGRLKVFTVVVDLWKRGILDAVFRRDMSRSSFERFLNAQSARRQPLKESTVEECRHMIARGVCVAKEFGFPLPLDFGLGKPLLDDLDEEVAAFDNPFLCSVCGGELDSKTVEKIRVTAPYDNIPVETRCLKCREKA